MIINELLILSGFIFTIWFYIDTKKSLEKIPDESTPPAPMPYQGPPVPYIQPAPTPAPVQINQAPPAPVPVPVPQETAPAAAAINREQLERIARNCLCASGCTFDTWTYCRYKSDLELMEIIKNYNFNR